MPRDEARALVWETTAEAVRQRSAELPAPLPEFKSRGDTTPAMHTGLRPHRLKT